MAGGSVVTTSDAAVATHRQHQNHQQQQEQQRQQHQRQQLHFQQEQQQQQQQQQQQTQEHQHQQMQQQKQQQTQQQQQQQQQQEQQQQRQQQQQQQHLQQEEQQWQQEQQRQQQEEEECGTSTSPELKKGLWTPEEDAILAHCVQRFKEGNWSTIAQKSGLNRSGKSCRLRWVKHLSPSIRSGPLSEEEQCKVIELQREHGNKWSLIAQHLPGRSDNSIKNFWNSYRKRVMRRSRSSATLLVGPDGGAAGPNSLFGAGGASFAQELNPGMGNGSNPGGSLGFGDLGWDGEDGYGDGDCEGDSDTAVSSSEPTPRTPAVTAGRLQYAGNGFPESSKTLSSSPSPTLLMEQRTQPQQQLGHEQLQQKLQQQQTIQLRRTLSEDVFTALCQGLNSELPRARALREDRGVHTAHAAAPLAAPPPPRLVSANQNSSADLTAQGQPLLVALDMTLAVGDAEQGLGSSARYPPQLKHPSGSSAANTNSMIQQQQQQQQMFRPRSAQASAAAKAGPLTLPSHLNASSSATYPKPSTATGAHTAAPAVATPAAPYTSAADVNSHRPVLTAMARPLALTLPSHFTHISAGTKESPTDQPVGIGAATTNASNSPTVASQQIPDPPSVPRQRPAVTAMPGEAVAAAVARPVQVVVAGPALVLPCHRAHGLPQESKGSAPLLKAPKLEKVTSRESSAPAHSSHTAPREGHFGISAAAAGACLSAAGQHEAKARVQNTSPTKTVPDVHEGQPCSRAAISRPSSAPFLTLPKPIVFQSSGEVASCVSSGVGVSAAAAKETGPVGAFPILAGCASSAVTKVPGPQTASVTDAGLLAGMVADAGKANHQGIRALHPDELRAGSTGHGKGEGIRENLEDELADDAEAKLKAEAEAALVQKRLRQLQEAKRVWEFILDSPRGMCAALRLSMPASLLQASLSGVIPSASTPAGSVQEASEGEARAVQSAAACGVGTKRADLLHDSNQHSDDGIGTYGKKEHNDAPQHQQKKQQQEQQQQEQQQQKQQQEQQQQKKKQHQKQQQQQQQQEQDEHPHAPACPTSPSPLVKPELVQEQTRWQAHLIDIPLTSNPFSPRILSTSSANHVSEHTMLLKDLSRDLLDVMDGAEQSHGLGKSKDQPNLRLHHPSANSSEGSHSQQHAMPAGREEGTPPPLSSSDPDSPRHLLRPQPMSTGALGKAASFSTWPRDCGSPQVSRFAIERAQSELKCKRQRNMDDHGDFQEVEADDVVEGMVTPLTCALRVDVRRRLEFIGTFCPSPLALEQAQHKPLEPALTVQANQSGIKHACSADVSDPQDSAAAATPAAAENGGLGPDAHHDSTNTGSEGADWNSSAGAGPCEECAPAPSPLAQPGVCQKRKELPAPVPSASPASHRVNDEGSGGSKDAPQHVTVEDADADMMSEERKDQVQHMKDQGFPPAPKRRQLTSTSSFRQRQPAALTIARPPLSSASAAAIMFADICGTPDAAFFGLRSSTPGGTMGGGGGASLAATVTVHSPSLSALLASPQQHQLNASVWVWDTMVTHSHSHSHSHSHGPQHSSDSPRALAH